MDFLWTAFLLGFVGSLHCAVMCGPLVLAVVGSRRASTSLTLSRLVYDSGRLLTYAALGAVFGFVGQTVALAGWQRWLSLTAGTLILVGLLLSARATLKTPVARLVMKLRTLFAELLQRRTLASQFALGSVNGLLPCGLVYIAAASAAATASPLGGAVHMAAFGLGTLPLLLSLALVGSRLHFLNRHAQRIVPATVAIVGVLLILRGMALGIPYLSPALGSCGACH